MLHAARLITDAEDAQAWGIQFDKPKVDLEALRRRTQAIIGKLTKGVQTLATSRKVDVIQARATFKNATTLALSGDGPRELSFAHAILATGSRPAMPPSLKVDDPRVMDSTGALDLPEIPGAAAGRRRRLHWFGIGHRVSGARLRGDGWSKPCRICSTGRTPISCDRCNCACSGGSRPSSSTTKVEKLEPRKDGIAVTCTGPDGSTKDVFDRVLVAVGRKPNQEQLGLEQTKIALSKQGFIQVDRHMRTAEPTIFAIGDVVGEPMLAHKASHEGLIAARVIAGQQAAFDATIPAVIFTDPEIAWCGLTEEAAKASGQAVTIARFPWAASGRATTLGRNDGLTKLVLDAESGRVLGVGICGVGAGELIAEGVLAVEMGAVAEDVAASIHPHPTLSETVMEAAEAFHGQPTHLYLSKTSKR